MGASVRLSRTYFVLFLTAMWLAFPTAMPAQVLGGMEGAVWDPSGAPVSGAAIRIVDTGRNAERTVATDGTGWYRAPSLAPGNFTIEASRSGFRTEIREGIEITAGRMVRLDFRLQISAAQESVTVVSSAPPVDTASSAWGGSIERAQLQSLPLNGRDLFDLAAQQVGVTVPPNAARTTEKGLGAHMSVNGSRPNQNGFLIDGIQVNDVTQSAPASAAGLLLGLEGIAELRIVASPFSAEYGRAAGGVLTAVSRSGTNAWHGSLFEYLRNSSVDARNFFDPAGEMTPPFRRNQFGALLSGPLRRDKLFLTSTYEGFRESLNKTSRLATLTEAARQGILPGRQVTVAPPVKPYFKLYPLPNGRDFGDGTAEFIGVNTARTREDHTASRVDALVSERWRFYGRHTFDSGLKRTAEPFGNWTYRGESGYQFLHTGAQYVPSASTIHSFRAAFSRVRNADKAFAIGGASSSLAYFKGEQPGALEVTGLPEIGGLAARLAPRRYAVNDFGFSYGATHIRGVHKLTFGAGYDRIQFNAAGDNAKAGFYRFSSVANFLQGITRSAETMAPDADSVRGWRQHLVYGFAQDEMRLGQRLNLTAGVRYEPYSTPTEVNGKIATLPNPLTDAAPVTGGPLFLNTSHKNFAPRLALAWDVGGNGKTVVRAGAGIFLDLLGTRELVVAGFRMPPYFRRLLISGAAFPDLMTALSTATVQNSVDTLEYSPRQPYMGQFQFSIERQLGRKSAVQAGYAGSRGLHLPGQYANINTTRPQYLADGRIFFPANTPALNPAFDQIGMRFMQQESSYHSLQASVRGSFRTGLRVQAKFAWAKSIDTNSSAIYADFAARMPAVFSSSQNRGLSDFDLKYSSAVNFSYELPAVASGRLGHIMGGWELHGLVQAQTGYPFSPLVGFDQARLRESALPSQRPDLIASPGTRIVLGDPQKYFDASAFGLPPAGYYGNLGRNVLRGPGLAVLNLALHKAVWHGERGELRLRVEMFNVTNHPNFQAPSDLLLFNSNGQRIGTAGRITATTTSARQIQLALRWSF